MTLYYGDHRDEDPEQRGTEAEDFNNQRHLRVGTVGIAFQTDAGASPLFRKGLSLIKRPLCSILQPAYKDIAAARGYPRSDPRAKPCATRSPRRFAPRDDG
jgi:hypothetical protein